MPTLEWMRTAAASWMSPPNKAVRRALLLGSALGLNREPVADSTPSQRPSVAALALAVVSLLALIVV